MLEGTVRPPGRNLEESCWAKHGREIVHLKSNLKSEITQSLPLLQRQLSQHVPNQNSNATKMGQETATPPPPDMKGLGDVAERKI